MSSFRSTIEDNLNSMRFDDNALKAAVPEGVYANFHASVNGGGDLEKDDRKVLATALMDWAMERGAVQYAHAFTPVRDNGANTLFGYKFDAFVDLDFGDKKTLKDPCVDFNATKLFLNETDGSSFPNGGLRATHTAAAFMSWDMTSPPYVRGDTLYIPACFVSHYGDALDDKTPLLRSQEAVNTQGLRLLRLLGDFDASRVVANVGWEQEFFIIDRDQHQARPDLMATGRTIIGAQPPRGQQTDANYFAQPNPRFKAFFEEAQFKLHALGQTLSVFHNEVAPSQHEYSPVFALTNVAADQNIVSIEVCSEVAAAHGLAFLCHEKPFAGLNGSGKHNNWGLNTDTGKNLYVPGKTDEDQAQFMCFVAALTRALDLHADVVRTSVSGAGNDHRLGAQEAPPAIMSLYTGANMSAHIDSIVAGGELAGYNAEQQMIDTGSSAVQQIPAGAEDRNRTAPFPFCGNRFEFRAVGSSQNIAFPMAVVNTAVAESLGHLADEIEGGKSVRDAVADTFKEHGRVIFNGDGYSDEWPVEAAKRGLPNLKNTVEAVKTLASDKNKALFDSMGVFKPHEVDARQEIMFERYVSQITMETDCMLEMMNTGVLPACAQDLQAFAGSGIGGGREDIYTALQGEVNTLQDLNSSFPVDADIDAQADYCVDVLKPQMEAVRELSDKAEVTVRDELWPYPRYRDMLFSHHYEESGSGGDDF